MDVKKSSLFLPCSWIYPYLQWPIFPMPDLEPRLPQMLCWNTYKVNSKCWDWNSSHHIWDQVAAREEFALIVATGLWIWRGVTSFKAVTLGGWTVMLVSQKSAIRNQATATTEIHFKNYFLAELAVIAKKNVWWLNRTGSVGSAAYGFCSSWIQRRWRLSLPRVSEIYFIALLPHIKPDSSA